MLIVQMAVQGPEEAEESMGTHHSQNYTLASRCYNTSDSHCQYPFTLHPPAAPSDIRETSASHRPLARVWSFSLASTERQMPLCVWEMEKKKTVWNCILSLLGIIRQCRGAQCAILSQCAVLG